MSMPAFGATACQTSRACIARRQVSPGAWPVMVMKPKLRIDAPMAAASRSTTQTLRPRCAAV
jgi:hypothetical protein